MANRDSKGRFIPGNKVSMKHGHGFDGITKEKAIKYTKKFYAKVPLKEWGLIVERAVKDAQGIQRVEEIIVDEFGEEIERNVVERGVKADARAREFIANYAIGKPTERVHVEHTIDMDLERDDPKKRLFGKLEELHSATIDGVYSTVQPRNGKTQSSSIDLLSSGTD